eukprot:3708916-Lingulodinium_polyedra.AAC.1
MRSCPAPLRSTKRICTVLAHLQYWPLASMITALTALISLSTRRMTNCEQCGVQHVTCGCGALSGTDTLGANGTDTMRAY